MKLTTQLELQSQTTRLDEHVSYAANSGVIDGILTLPDALFQETYIQVTRWLHVETLQSRYNRLDDRFSTWALLASLAVTKSIIVIFFSSPY